MSTITLNDVLRQADAVLLRDGWTQRSWGLDFYPDGMTQPSCISGALHKAMRELLGAVDSMEYYDNPVWKDITDKVYYHPDVHGPGSSLLSWNDAPGRTVEEVRALLKSAMVD